MSVIFFFFIFHFSIALIAIFLWWLRWNITNKKNKNRINFNENNINTVDFRNKYYDLAKEHDALYNKNKKNIIAIFFVIAAFVSFFLGYFIYTIIIIIISAFLAIIMNNASTENKLKEKYNNILYNDIICKLFNVVKKNDFELYDDTTYEQFLVIEEIYEKQEQIIKNIMTKTNKKQYRMYGIDFDIDCFIKEKNVNIKRFYNYEKDRIKFNCAYIGHLITIFDFSNKDILKEIDESHYFYDNKNNILYLLIAEEFTKDKPNFSKTFDKCKFLESKYNYYIQLKDIIDKFL